MSNDDVRFTDEQIKHMVDRFLWWRLPEHFSPDAGISFTPEYNVEFNAARGKPPNRHEPVGTNLFTASQAEAMVRHMVEGLPRMFPDETAFDAIDDCQVLDRHTGLIWTRADVPGGPMDWKAAQAACAALELGGARGWRLPTVEELFLLADRTRHSPAIDPVFECASDFYWTSTPAAASAGDYAWVVGFGHGLSFWFHQDDDCPVRAVRSNTRQS